MSHPNKALWDAINRYVISCGGNPDKHVYGNTRRMEAVTAVENAVADLTAGAVNSVIGEALNSGDGTYRP